MLAFSIPFVEAPFKRIRDLDHPLWDRLLNTDKSYFLKVLHNNFDDNDFVVYCWQPNKSFTLQACQFPQISGPLGRSIQVEAGYSKT